MEIITTPDDILRVNSDEDGRIRFSINKVTIVMPPLTATLVAREINESLKIAKRPRQTLRPQ